MAEPPFPNEYSTRLVADSDAKACHVCFKPACTVMLSANKADFFYVCASHLKDASFAVPIHPDSYNELLSEKKKLQAKVASADATAEANRPYSWNKLMGNLGWAKDAKDKSSDSDKDKGKDSKENDKAKTYEELLRAAGALKSELAQLTSDIDAYVFKKFALNKEIYRIRINTHLQAKARARRAKEMHEPLFFPTAPSGSPA